MLDLSHIPNSQQDIKILYSNGITNAWQTWQKPRKCQWVWIMCIGGGAGGGSGFFSPGANYSTGGGSGAVTRVLFNASHLPDILYIQVGIGGAGGLGVYGGGNNGSPGTRSWVAITPAVVATNIVVGSGGSANAGGKGDATGTNAAGEAAITTTTMTFGTLANFISTIGVTAVGSTTIFNPPDITPLTSQVVTCGGGGGNWFTGPPVDIYPGGSILATPLSPLIPSGIATQTSGSTGGTGANGITSWKPFFSTGGAGGGIATSGSGGNGGNGGIGSGGGGGAPGNGNLLYPGGNGGKGGDGLVVIIAF